MTIKQQNIIKLSEREHILKRSGMYLGSSTITKVPEYILENDKFVFKEIQYVPGLVKIFNELIDNSIDEFVRTRGTFADKINIHLSEDTFSVEDNGRGIPVVDVKTPEGTISQPELAWTHARAGSNFEDDNSATIGTNGVGSLISSVFSKSFVGISQDGTNKCVVKCKDNNSTITTKVTPSINKGVKVTIVPELERFGLKTITQPHTQMIEQRLYNLSVAYPDITFKLNNKKIKIKSKDFINKFGDNGAIIENTNFSIGVFHSDTDDFKHFSLMNGLTLSNGGTHVDYLSNYITSALRAKIIKKYKTIKPGDIKQKLFIVVLMKNFSGPQYESQTKEKLTNSQKQISEYFKDLDLETFSKKVLNNGNIIDSITDYFKIKEEFKKQKDLKNLGKVKKRIKSEKYIKSIGQPKRLFIVEGQSALGGTLPAIGRQGNAYYVLKGKPLNAITSSHKKFTQNVELSELFQIINSENFDQIIAATDQDLDGIHINGLLLAFFYKYLPNIIDDNKFFRLNTPIAVASKNRKITNWVYNYDEIETLKGEISFKKGLGSFKEVDFKHIIKTDGIDKMIMLLSADDDYKTSLLNWFSNDTADKRKEAIMSNDFNLIKL